MCRDIKADSPLSKRWNGRQDIRNTTHNGRTLVICDMVLSAAFMIQVFFWIVARCSDIYIYDMKAVNA